MSASAYSYEPFYWEEHDYGPAVQHLHLTPKKILQMGLARFRDVHNAAYEKEFGVAPRNADGNEQAELIYLWVRRQDNLYRLAHLPRADRNLLQQLDRALAQIEYCESGMRGADTAGGTAWIAYERGLGLHHEAVLSDLIRFHSHWRDPDKRARTAFNVALAGLEHFVRSEKQKVEKHKNDAEYYLDMSWYQRSLTGFTGHLQSFRKMTAGPLPPGVLRVLTRHLPEYWWQSFDKAKYLEFKN